MKKNQTLLFKKLSTEFEEVLMDELHTLKGGTGGSDNYDIDGGELDEVVIHPDNDEDDEGPEPMPDPDPEPDDDWENDDNNEEDDWNEDDWNNNHENEQEDEQQEDKVCTCEVSTHEPGEIPEIKDANGLLSGLKTELASREATYKSMLKTGNFMPGITSAGVQSGLDAISKINKLITTVEDSNKSFRFELGSVSGSGGVTSKDLSTGEYVITVNANDYGLLIHELVHAGQIESSEIGFDAAGNATMLGLDDEVKAYQLQYDFNAGASGNGLTATASSIKASYPGIYDKLPAKGGKCPVHG